MLYTINSYYDLLLIKYMSLYFYYIVTLIYLIVHIMYRIAFEINYSILFYSNIRSEPMSESPPFNPTPG